MLNNIKTYLVCSFILISGLIPQTVNSQERPSCEEQFNTWALMYSCSQICEFDLNINQFIRDYGKQAKVACSGKLTKSKIHELLERNLIFVRDEYQEMREELGEESGHDAFCSGMEELILDLQTRND